MYNTGSVAHTTLFPGSSSVSFSSRFKTVTIRAVTAPYFDRFAVSEYFWYSLLMSSTFCGQSAVAENARKSASRRGSMTCIVQCGITSPPAGDCQETSRQCTHLSVFANSVLPWFEQEVFHLFVMFWPCLARNSESRRLRYDNLSVHVGLMICDDSKQLDISCGLYLPRLWCTAYVYVHSIRLMLTG